MINNESHLNTNGSKKMKKRMRIDYDPTPVQEAWALEEIERVNNSGTESLKFNKRELSRRLIEAGRLGIAYQDLYK